MTTKIKIFAFLSAFMFSYGCITIPTPENKVLSGEKISIEQLVFIEQGTTSKSEIIDHLVLPNVNLIDKNIFAYDWQTRQAIMIWAIGGPYQASVGAVDIPKNYVFLIRFDAQDLVKNYEITTRSWYESYGDHLMEWIHEKSE
jgi:hypothetical protein